MADINKLLDALPRMRKFRSAAPATQRHVEEMEKQLGVKLDPAYAALLRRFGYVGWFGNSVFGYFELDEENWPGYDWDAVRRTKEARKEKPPKGCEPLPRDAVVIGDDQSGGYFVLRSTAAKPPGEVVWFQYEDSAPSFQRWRSFTAYFEWMIKKG
jgi:hypothetical protein